MRTPSAQWISPVEGRSAKQASQLLGTSFDCVVLDLHDGLDADALGVASGLVWGGGALVLRLPGGAPPPDPGLALHPFPAAAVGRRAWSRLEAWLARHATDDGPALPLDPTPAGTPAQAAVVDALVAAWSGPGPTRAVLLADRGRGKSAALGLALARLPVGARAVLTSGDRRSVEAAERFAGRDVFVDLADVLNNGTPAAVLVVDEAARLPVPTLQALVRAAPGAHLAFATTHHGYEGTGRGFVLRFLDWLRAQGPVTEHRLSAPIRWAPNDPLEAAVADLLALDAAPAPLPAPGAVAHRRLDRDALARDEPLLRQVFGLLVHAHYRTTPADLVRMLDAPNLELHALFDGDTIVAVNLVAREGGLPPELCRDAAAGRGRLRGHALADTLVTHAGRPDAGLLDMVRSVRIATHPDARRRGLGRQLADAVHDACAPDLFGTLFGATPEVLAFRRAQGYRLVRVGGSRGDRTGEPAAVMARPVSPAAVSLVEDLVQQLARDLPHQLRWLAAEAPLDPALAAALAHDLPTPTPLAPTARDAALRGWLDGARTSDAVAAALVALVEAADLTPLDETERAVIEARVVRLASWRATARAAGLPSVRATQRALKQAARRLLSRAAGPGAPTRP